MPAARWARRSTRTASTSGTPDRDVPDHPFWGPAVDAEGTRAGGARGRPGGRRARRRGARSSGSRTSSPPGASSAGWMAPAEFGPRALGHRSILAAPHAREMRDRLNRDIKHREEFRPFAPVVHRRSGGPVFRTARRRRAARALHVGRVPGAAGVARGSRPSRTWTDRRGCRCSSARWRRGCTRCSRRTGAARGIPVLLNTSFNVAGEPIVNAALEGYSTFRRCGIDALVAGLGASSPSAPSARRNWQGGSRVITKRERHAATHRSMLGEHGRIDRGSRCADCGEATPATRWLVPLAVFLCLLRLDAHPGERRSRRSRRSSTRSSDAMDAFRELARLPGLRRERCRPDWSCTDAALRFDVADGDPQPADLPADAAHRDGAPLLRARAVPRLSAA